MKVQWLVLSVLMAVAAQAKPLPPLDLGEVSEEQVWIPMRDGVRLSAYLYRPRGDGRWPVLFEQRYADITGSSTRKNAATLAARGYAVAMVSFRGSQESEGTYQGYRALAWGEQQDGYDVCEWLATQPWCTGKAGTFGSSQGGFAQNFLAVTRPPHLVCQYMVDTGLSLFHEGYRIGGVTGRDGSRISEPIAVNRRTTRLSSKHGTAIRIMTIIGGRRIVPCIWKRWMCPASPSAVGMISWCRGAWPALPRASIMEVRGRGDGSGSSWGRGCTAG